jgi:hypothetical protein
MREPFPPRRREKGKVKSLSPPREVPALPFIKQGVQVTLMRWDKTGEREYACPIGVRGQSLFLMQRVPSSLVPAGCYCHVCLSVSGPGATLPHACGLAIEFFWYLMHAWLERCAKLLVRW